MSSEKHFSLRRKPDMFSRHPAPGDNAADFLLQLLDRLGLSRSGPISRGATGPRYFFLAGVRPFPESMLTGIYHQLRKPSVSLRLQFVLATRQSYTTEPQSARRRSAS